MSPHTASKQDTKTALLEAGKALMQERGYTATGVQDVLSQLGMPKGSFYHHFESKENFAVEIIRYFDQEYSALLSGTLGNTQFTPLQRLHAYCDTIKQMLSANDCRKGCLIGNLSAEMSDQSEVLRNELCTVVRKWREMFAQCISEGQQSGEIKNERRPEDLAEAFLGGWSGAIMRAKTIKNTEPLDTFMEVMFEDVLKR